MRNGKSDLWAVGVICWELLCPSNPWNVDFGRVREREIVKVRHDAPRMRAHTLAHINCTLTNLFYFGR